MSATPLTAFAVPDTPPAPRKGAAVESAEGEALGLIVRYTPGVNPTVNGDLAGAAGVSVLLSTGGDLRLGVYRSDLVFAQVPVHLRHDGRERNRVHRRFGHPPHTQAVHWGLEVGYHLPWSANSGDGNDHGTHVAGTVSGTTYGIAKKTMRVPVRVFDCTGSVQDSTTTSDLPTALDWIIADHAAGEPAVVNISLGSRVDTLLDAKVQAVINDGITAVVTSGNEGSYSGDSSPARVPNAITVNASTKQKPMPPTRTSATAQTSTLRAVISRRPTPTAAPTAATTAATAATAAATIRPLTCASGGRIRRRSSSLRDCPRSRPRRSRRSRRSRWPRVHADAS